MITTIHMTLHYKFHGWKSVNEKLTTAYLPPVSQCPLVLIYLGNSSQATLGSSANLMWSH
jgi:hypothetical protein